MNELRRGERGASILASLVIVAMLGAAALVADFGTNVSQSQQTAAATAGTAANQTIKDDLKPETIKEGNVTKTVNYACQQQGKVTEIKSLQQTCTPGFIYRVLELKGTITVVPRPNNSIACPTSAPQKKCQIGGEALKSCSLVGATSPCVVEYCVAKASIKDVECKQVGNQIQPGQRITRSGTGQNGRRMGQR